jgi:DNA-binding NarL/FixJ family response regulator
MPGLRLIIVDDDAGIRYILRSLVESLGAEVVAEADNGEEAIRQTEHHHPELVLMDVSMPVMGGLPATQYLSHHYPELRILMVSQYNQKAYVREALRVGANGYILKSAAASELGPAIHAVMNGGIFVSSAIATRAAAANE